MRRLIAPYFLTVFLAGTLMAPGSGFANEAIGKFLLAIGAVQIDRAGSTFQVKKDTEIQVGDLIKTGPTSNAQIRFTDGAVVALRPESEFKVDQYRYSGKPDGSEKASISLVKGGMRAVTGAIGRTNRDNLNVNAVVATVGIRGTGFNVTFCDAVCKARNPTAKEGLYAGVFEGKINVATKVGKTDDIGVNRFVYVPDANSTPQSLVEPPKFLKDSLEGQVRVKTQAFAANQATETNAASGEKSAATKTVAEVRAPVSQTEVVKVSAEKVRTTDIAIKPPEIVNTFPSSFFDLQAVGSGSTPPDNVVGRLRAARFDPLFIVDPIVNTNQAISGYTTVAPQPGEEPYKIIAFGNVPTPYSVQPQYWKEGGRSEGVISWGRWAGDPSASLGQFGVAALEANQGFHYMYGFPATSLPADRGNITMALIGGTVPTEVRANAETGWRLTGGSLNVNFNTLTMSGLLNLYVAKSSGYGFFDMTWNHNMATVKNNATDAGKLEAFSPTMRRTSGTIGLCTSSCGVTATMGFYGPQSTGSATHAGMAYTADTGAYKLQGVAVFK